MKSTLPTLLSLSFSILLAGACSLEGVEQPPEQGGLSLLSNGPDLPEECNVCWEDFQSCFADGSGAEQCIDGIIECIEACE